MLSLCSIPTEDPSGKTLIISPVDFERIKAASRVISDEEREVMRKAISAEKMNAAVGNSPTMTHIGHNATLGTCGSPPHRSLCILSHRSAPHPSSYPHSSLTHSYLCPHLPCHWFLCPSTIAPDYAQSLCHPPTFIGHPGSSCHYSFPNHSYDHPFPFTPLSLSHPTSNPSHPTIEPSPSYLVLPIPS